jgi:hypothetical protein
MNFVSYFHNVANNVKYDIQCSTAKMLNILMHSRKRWFIFVLCAAIFYTYFSESDCLLFSNPSFYLFPFVRSKSISYTSPLFRKTGRKREGISPLPPLTSSSSPPPSPPSVRRRGSLAAPPPSRAVPPPPSL